MRRYGVELVTSVQFRPWGFRGGSGSLFVAQMFSVFYLIENLRERALLCTHNIPFAPWCCCALVSPRTCRGKSSHSGAISQHGSFDFASPREMCFKFPAPRPTAVGSIMTPKTFVRSSCILLLVRSQPTEISMVVVQGPFHHEITVNHTIRSFPNLCAFVQRT